MFLHCTGHNKEKGIYGRYTTEWVHTELKRQKSFFSLSCKGQEQATYPNQEVDVASDNVVTLTDLNLNYITYGDHRDPLLSAEQQQWAGIVLTTWLSQHSCYSTCCVTLIYSYANVARSDLATLVIYNLMYFWFMQVVLSCSPVIHCKQREKLIELISCRNKTWASSPTQCMLGYKGVVKTGKAYNCVSHFLLFIYENINVKHKSST